MTPSLVVTTSRKPAPLAEREAADWAARLAARAVPRTGRAIGTLCREEGVQGVLVISAHRPPTYVSADETVHYFYHPGMALTRVKHLIAGKGDPMVTVMGLAPGDSVLDCTLGRASDAIVASFVVGPTGRVIGLESSPLIAALTIHGLQTYVPPNRKVEAAMRAIDARHTDHLAFLRACSNDAFEVVYFDPLFSEPVTASSAMQPLRPLADDQPLSHQAVAEARRVASRSVVVKERPRAPLWKELGVTRVGGGKNSSIAYGVL